MSIQIKDNSAKIVLETTKNASLGLRYIAEAVVDESTPHTPKDEGNLQRDVIKQVLGLNGSIQWRKVYAQAQERGYWVTGPLAGVKIKNYTTPGTGPHFAENAIRKVAKNYMTYFRKARLVK